MLQLTKDEKEILKAFKNHEGFRILEKIEQEARTQLAETLANADLSDEKQIEILRKNQIYMRARQDFYSNLERYTQDIQGVNFPGID